MDREVIVYLPPGYNTQSARRYPVLYILHGWGGYNLQHTTEWESWGLLEGIQEAIVKGAARPMIVVQPLSFLPTGECSLYFNHGPGTDGKLCHKLPFRKISSLAADVAFGSQTQGLPSCKSRESPMTGQTPGLPCA